MARISQSELQNSIARQTKFQSKETLNASAKPDIVYYTIFGKHTETDEDGNPTQLVEKGALAKQIRRGTKYDYYVMVGNSGRLFDPLGLYATRETSKMSQTRGKPELRLCKTNQQVFDLYVRYLRTKNKAWLRNAEREM